MRAQRLVRAAGFIASTTLLAAASSLAMTSAAGADPGTTPSPTTSPTSSPSPTTSPAPTKETPVQPSLLDTVDASVAIHSKVFAEKPKSATARFTVRSTKPATGYRLTIKVARELGMHAINNDGWSCKFSDTGNPVYIYTCDYLGKATVTPNEISASFEMPQKAGLKFRLSASVTTTETDSNPANNTAAKTIVVPADKPSSKPGKGKGIIAGRVWNDANGNGRQDTGEKSVAGAKVLLFFATADSTVSDFTGPVTTGADGRYSFKNLAPHVPDKTAYGVIVAAPGKNWVFTRTSVGAERGDSDFRPIGSDAVLEGELGNGAVMGFHDRVDVFAGQTTVLDAGLVKKGGTGAGTGDELPKTGAGMTGFLAAGGALLAAGAGLVLLGRRRRTV
jgi:LPXTG-motif cell wall-anchored protein